MGNVAHRVGKKLEWDAAKMEAKGAPEASEFLTKTYREGWNPFLPEVRYYLIADT